MIGALLIAGLGAVALGGALTAVRRATFLAGLYVQAAGAVALAAAGFWALLADVSVGSGFAELGASACSVFIFGLSECFKAQEIIHAGPRRQ